MRGRGSFAGKKRKARKTAAVVHGLSRRFRITHPFHPRTGEEFDLIEYRRGWGRECVEGLDSNGKLLAVPLGWTDAGGGPDPIVALSAGKSFFRIEDLLLLAELLQRLRSAPSSDPPRQGPAV